MARLLRWTGLVLLAALAGPVSALGLGQIEVKSRPGQPLVAEIPIISSDPAELQGLQVGLASPETFQRIGLQPPQGIVSDLQFTPAVDARGRPIIRVTTQAPVQQPLLTFLVEVDWGQGRLVREYSALVDAPGTVAAQAQPPVQAPVGAPANTIVRPVEPPVAGQPDPSPVAQPVEPPPGVSSVPPVPDAAIPVPPPVATAPAPAAAVAPESNEYGPVRAGDTLGEIARQLDAPRGYTLDQTMLALLRANPEAFIGDDINRLRQGAVLRIPRPDELSRYSASEAAAVVRDQIARWREARRPQVQPAVQAASTAAAAARADGGRRVAGARLEIVPPTSADARRAGTRSGINAGGEGEMLRQELQQTKETLAARDAEVEELKTRVAELEQLQQQQQQLITLKDSELAAAQQRLAASNARQAMPAAAPAQPVGTTAATPAAPAAEPQRSETIGWAWLVPLLLVLGAIGWWWSRRRAGAPRPARTFDTAALAAGMPNADAATPGMGSADLSAEAVETTAEPALPMWTSHAKPVPSAPATAVPPLPATPEPTWHGGTISADTVAPLNPAPAGHERIELARAYLDMGDRVTARSLLQEVVDNGDAAARDEASQLLRELA